MVGLILTIAALPVFKKSGFSSSTAPVAGFNFLDRAIKIALGENIDDIKMTDKIYNFVSYLKSGDKVETFLGANAALGVLIMKYESREVMDEIVENFHNLYKVELQ